MTDPDFLAVMNVSYIYFLYEVLCKNLYRMYYVFVYLEQFLPEARLNNWRLILMLMMRPQGSVIGSYFLGSVIGSYFLGSVIGSYFLGSVIGSYFLGDV